MDYSSLAERINSFKNCPNYMKHRINILSEAGFYYTGKNDGVRCYTCEGGLKDWNDEDDPWIEHALWYGDKCMYIQIMKGVEFIQNIKRKFKQRLQMFDIENIDTIIKTQDPDVLNNNTLGDNDNKCLSRIDETLCKICYNNY